MTRLIVPGAILMALAAFALTTALSQAQQYDPVSDWGIESGFVISVDSEGYDLPIAIALVPDPGDSPEDPAYFVTELGGKIKVVTNDRSVHTFAEDFFELKPHDDLPSKGGEVGLDGICLDPRRGYLFVTFAYDDADGILRNNVMRFETRPETFSIKPAGQMEFSDVFIGDESSPSHQIGSCQVDGDFLLVSVGDGEKPAFSQILESTLGKVLRMALDGNPVPDNPFYVDDERKNPANYVWAMGFRNPFGLKTVNGRVFVADNGPDLDRFLEAQPGRNYLWDGADPSIGANAAMVLSPSSGVVQMDRYPTGSSLFPEQYQQSFFLTRSGNLPWTPQPESRRPPNIVIIDYSIDSANVLNTPKQFLRYQGDQDQMLVGVAIGSTGLYFVPLNPDRRGVSAVYKITFQSGQSNPLNKSALEIMGQKGCFACHNIKGTGGFIGPPLDMEGLVTRVRSRLDSPEYIQNIEDIDRLDREPFISFRQARREVLNSEGIEQVRTWLEYRIQEPRFDSAAAVMPTLGLSQEEAELIADFLLTPPETEGFIDIWIERGGQLFPRPRKRHLAYYFFAGFILGGAGFGMSYFGAQLLQHRRRAR